MTAADRDEPDSFALATDLRSGEPLGRGLELHLQPLHHFAILVGDFFLLEPGQSLQSQLEDRLRLAVRQSVAVCMPPIFGRKALRTRRIGQRAFQHLFDNGRTPGFRHQRCLRVGRCSRRLDERNDRVDVRQRDRQAFENMAAFPRLRQIEARAPDDDFTPVLQKEFDELLEIQQPRLTVDERNHVHAEAVLQLRQLEQVVRDDVGHFPALQLDYDAHA